MRMKAVTRSTTSVHAAAEARRLKARELSLIVRVREAVAEPADSLDEIDGKLLAQAPDEHLDGIGVAVEILLVEMLDQLGARDDALTMQHEISEHAIFVRGELDRATVHRHPRGLGVEAERSAFHLVAGMPGGTAEKRGGGRHHLCHIEGPCL